MTTATTVAEPAALADAANGGSGDWPYRFEIVPLPRLFVDAAYQRDLTSFVDRIVRNFKPALVGTLVLSDRSTSPDSKLRVRVDKRERYAVIDGQTRMEALGQLEHENAPAVVFEGLTQADEARLFAQLQTQRRNMATFARFRAALVSEDPEALAIEAIVKRHGYETGFSSKAGSISAISALEKAYRAGYLDRILETVRAAWPDRVEGDVSGDVLGGLRVFYRRTKNVDDTKLADRLASVTPSMLKHRANALREGAAAGGGNAPGFMADAILGVYMQRGRR